MEFQDLYGDAFFIIDSNNINLIKQKLYGYGLNNDKLILDENISDVEELNGIGAYIFLEVKYDEIIIHQDFIGSYGVYIYKDENYFALSNSFLKLVEYLKDKKFISFNEDYANAFLFSDVCSFAYKETLINEIIVIPRNYKIKINKLENNIQYEEIDFEEHSIDLDSEDGIKILDDWYLKWVNIIRNLKSKTNNIEINLSGGFDTRVIAALWLTANIDINQIKILTFEGDKGFIAEDYKIASAISDEFNFQLNNNILFGREQNFKELNTALDISFYTKLGFHKEMYWRLSRLNSPLFSISGNGGEILRSVYDSNVEDYVGHIVEYAQEYSNSLVESSEYLIRSGLEEVNKKKNVDSNSKDLPELYYKEVRTRNHYGKSAVEKYFSNIFTLTPLTDPDLQKLKLFSNETGDRSLLITLILLRYCPKLLDFDVEGNRKFEEKIITQAESINAKYPFKKPNYDFISFNGGNHSEGGRKKDISNPDNLLRNIADSNIFEVEFKKHYGSMLYNKLMGDIKTRYHYSLTHIYSALAILIIIHYVDFNRTYMDNSTSELVQNLVKKPKSSCLEVNSFSMEQRYLACQKYNFGRIDIINSNSSKNSIEILEISDDNSSIDFPNWFKTESGMGCIIESEKFQLDIKLKCVYSGILNIYLRGIDYKINDIRVPIYINYKKLLVNNVLVFNSNKIVWHDEPYHFSTEVTDQQIINLHIEWAPI